MQWLQYLVELGLRGSHPLFEKEHIRNAFGRNMKELNTIGPTVLEEINSAIKNVLQASDIETQRDLIRALEPDVRDILVHLYFQMIDRNLIDSDPTKH